MPYFGTTFRLDPLGDPADAGRRGHDEVAVDVEGQRLTLSNQDKVPQHAPDWLRTAPLANRHDDGNGTNDHPVLDDLPSLVWATMTKSARTGKVLIDTPMTWG